MRAVVLSLLVPGSALAGAPTEPEVSDPRDGTSIEAGVGPGFAWFDGDAADVVGGGSAPASAVGSHPTSRSACSRREQHHRDQDAHASIESRSRGSITGCLSPGVRESDRVDEPSYLGFGMMPARLGGVLDPRAET